MPGDNAISGYGTYVGARYAGAEFAKFLFYVCFTSDSKLVPVSCRSLPHFLPCTLNHPWPYDYDTILMPTRPREHVAHFTLRIYVLHMRVKNLYSFFLSYAQLLLKGSRKHIEEWQSRAEVGGEGSTELC